MNLTNNLYPYNDRLEVNMYKNIIIDLYFLEIPTILFDSKISLDVLFGESKDNTGDLKFLYKMAYGFDYFGKKSMILFFMLYFKAFYNNITLYEYNDRYYHLSQILTEYSTDKIQEFKNNTILQEKLYNYSTFISGYEDGYISHNLDLPIEIYKDILEDTSLVNQLHYECTGFVSPLDYQEINNSYLSEYCLLYHFEKNFMNTISDHMIDEGVEVYLNELLESNLNSKWFTSLILSE